MTNDIPAKLLDKPVSRASWRPVLFRPSVPAEQQALRILAKSDQIREVHDTLDEQLEELVRSRAPGRAFVAADMEGAKEQVLDGVVPWHYGTWVWYPWSGRLIHVLPREEFRLVRTDRNRGKIDRPEQTRLLQRRIGIIGLSVGNSAAVTLALEGIGGAFKLADFDTLGLSNLNRLRAGVHDLGVNKTVIAARQMFEIDPYLDIEIYPSGLTDDTMEEFFTGGGVSGPIDLLVEESDTPYVKVASREYARACGVPVLMDANDRGMLDIERFDLEPNRPVLHGLLGQLTSSDLREPTFEEKVSHILAILDEQQISPELATSLDQIGHTLSSWPQLASGVALGGAITADAARRILLGTHRESGRYYVDLAALIADGQGNLTNPCRA
ncbi:ThiF family adenylyltransferase [Streptomyces sp. NPDC058701]|uniref:ThiF family adenylyltransferase n=1 Tax=Streptomyces sp. NPDC058701 TaxID=3346608 RepID=UPI00365BB7FA